MISGRTVGQLPPLVHPVYICQGLRVVTPTSDQNRPRKWQSLLLTFAELRSIFFSGTRVRGSSFDYKVLFVRRYLPLSHPSPTEATLAQPPD